MELIKKRYASALRKFLAYEIAQGRYALFPDYQYLMRQAIEAGAAMPVKKSEKLAASRLAQVGLLDMALNIVQVHSHVKIAKPHYRLPCMSEDGAEDGFPADSFWLQRKLTALELLRFYQMPSVAIEWVLSDLELQVVQLRHSNPDLHHWICTNTHLLSRIWRIALYQELTLAVEPPDLGDFGLLFSQAKNISKRAHVSKEKLGLAKMPNVFQMRHIRATCHYMRKSAAL